MTTVRNVACVFLMAAGLVSAQPMLDLQESPPASGLLTARLTSSYAATGFGSAKIWTFNAEANDRVTFLVRTDASTGANPIIRLIAPSGSTVSQLAGSYDGFASLENVSLPTPGVYQVAVYSDSKVSAFSLSVLLGRGVELESESNDLRTLADEPRFFPQGGGFKGVIAGVLDRDADWDDLGMLSAGQSVNLSLQPPSGSSLSASGVELALFKDADTSPVLTSTGGSLVHTVASAGNYRVRVRVPDLDGRNLHFEGSQSVSLGNPEALRITGSQTVEFWIKPDDFNTRQNPYAKAYAGEGTMTIETDGTVNYFYGTGGGNNAPYQTFNTGTPLRAGRWQHLALVRDFSSTPKQLRWYLDGKLVAQAEASYFPAVASSLDATIGTGYAGNLRGSMDEVRIWNSPRSASEILDNLDNSLAGTESGLAAYYKFSEGSGTSTADASTSAITGTISGVPTWEGFTSANLTNFVAQGQNSSYFLSASISDTSVPSVTSVDLAPNRGHLIDGTSFAPYNMSALAANVGQSYLYTLQGDTSGSIAGTDSYTVDSYLGKAAVHAGVLLPSEIGAVRVTIQPGLPSYYSSFRNGVSSSLGVGTSASYRIERYVPAVPFTLDAIYTSVTVSFDEEMDETTLASGVTLSAAGPDGNFGTADDISYPLVFSSFTGNRRAIFQLGGGRILLPGAHRLTVPATVTDRAGNPLASAYVKNFTVLGVDAYVNEDGDNGSIATADTISTGVQAGQADGSFLDLGRTTATGGWPFDIETADFDGDGKTDAAVTHLGSLDALRIYPGDGARGFGASINFDGIGDEPYDVQLIDWDKDGDLDLAVTLAGPDKVGFFRNDSTPGNIVFTRQADVTVGDWPRRLALGDFNADGYPDLVVSNNGANATTGYSVSVLLNDKAGSFTESKLGLTLSPKLRPWGIAAGDFNKDGKADIAVADTDNGDRLAVFLGVGDGTFGAPTFLDMPDGPDVTDLKTADFNKDGNPDLVAVATGNSLYTYWIFPGNGDGTFGTRADFPLGYGYYNELVKVADVNGDSWPDLLLGGNDHVTVASNRADGTLGFGTVRRNWYETYGVAAADLNGDGRAELIVADHDNYLLRVLDGNARSPLAADDTAQGMRHGFGRGFLSDDSDLDFWSFSASRGQVLTVAVDHSTVADNAGLYWEIYDETGAYLTGFTNTNSSWRGESPPVVIPRDGTYYVRVSPYYSYRGEYRFRASLAPSGTQVERENNNQISQANGVTFTLSGNSLGATVGGYMAGYDTSGDFYGLGNLASGTQVDVTVRIPSTSGLVPTLALFKSDGTQVTPDELTPTRLVYTLQVGDESTYYVRVGGSAGLGLMAEYFADISIADTVPPTITSNSLPAQGSTVTYLAPSFTLGFSEDMLAATVNDLANYTLVGSGGDGTFSDGNEVIYHLRAPGYTSGLSASYFITDGPLQPDSYRFTAGTGLKDKLNNNLAAPHVREFTVTGVPGYVSEDRDNGTIATADTISTGVLAGQADGSFLDLGRTTATGGWPFDIETADLDGDGKTDAAVTHLGSLDALRIYPGDGARGFGASINFDGIGDEPYDVQLIDWDKDGDLDLAVTLAGPDKVGFFRNDSTPGNIVFTRQADVTVGDWPRRLALGDFNSDGYPDLVVSNNGTNGTTGYSVSVLLNDKAGSFTESKLGLTLSPKLRPWGIAAGDFNKDGKADIAVADTDNGDRLAVFLGVGDGTFGAPTFLDMPDGPDVTDLKTADFNKDGNPDLVAVATGNSLYTYWIFPGNGDGTFGTRADFPLGYGYYNELVKVADVNGDSWPDLLLGGNDHVTVASNRADGTLGFGTVRRNWYETYGVAAADLNGDGRAELIVADHDNYLLRVLDGNARSPLAADDTTQGVRHGFGRGFLSEDSDLDFWSFSASRGQVLTVAVDLSTATESSGLSWEIYDETGAYLTGFTNTNTGWRGESPPVVIPRDGTYYIRVSQYYGYRGEYRFRASLAPAGTQVERENNNQISQANGVTFTLSGNSLGATVGGYMAGYDTSGDFFGLGNLASGTQVDVTVRIPSTSGLVPTLALFKSDGTQVTPDELTPTRLVYTLQAGDESTYYVRVGGSAGLGLMAEYFADISIADTVPPTITSNSLPAQGSTVTYLAPSFTLGFSEDMLAATVNDLANYTLVGSGGDGTFSDGNEVSYHVRAPGYTSGLSASYFITDGPLQPDSYRFTAGTGLKDKLNNNLAAPHVREFTVAGVPGYVSEDRDNGSIATADTISTGVQAGQGDGSFLDLGRTTATGGWPFDIETADLDGDGKTDAAVTHLGSLDALRIYPGDGARGFGASINFDGLGDEPYDVQLIDWDKDGDLDLAVTLAGPDKVGFFRNDSTPGNIVFTRQADVTVGDWPRRLALGDFNSDGYPDLVVSNNGTNGTTGYSVSVLLNDKAGSFTESKLGLTLSPKLRPWGIAAGDFNKDGKADIAVADTDNGDRLAVFLGVGDGTFGAPTFLDMPEGPEVTDLKTADFNKDGNPDLVAVATGNSLYTYWIFPGNGDGTFGTRADFPLGYGYYNELVKVADVNGDSWPDLLLGGNDHVTVAMNRADGTLGFGTVRRNWYETYGVAAADLNGDGRAELIVADHDNYLLRVLDGNARSPLAADDTAQGMRHGFGRGFLSDDSDLDFWSFSASRGQVLTVAVDHSTVADNAGLYWEIYDETGAYLTGFTNTNSSWRGESPPVVIPRDGTYYVRVSPYYSYRGEYRFRASLAPSGTQVERENNNQISQANGVTFTLSGNSLGATVGGYMAGYDTSGDFYGLGNLASGTQVDVTVRIPSTSGLVPTLALFKSDGTQVTPDELTPTRLVYTLQAGDESTYYVRVGGSAGLGLMAEYFADISIADTVPPTITASSLPNPSSDGMVTSFSLSFNKDMLASTVNTTSNYTLVWAGPDGSFSTADDAVIPVIPANYTSGLSNNYTISNGPLRPGNYVFTATTGLRDKTGNNLPLPFQRAFSITGPAGFATETEPNNSGATASQLVFDTSIPGYLTANARGVLSSSEDVEYWTFPAQSGDVMAFEVFMQYEPDSYLLNWYLTDPDGQVVFERNLGNNSLETNNPITLSKTGDYRLRIDDYHGIRTEHRFRVSLMRGLQSESEQNDSLGTADPVTFTQVGGISTASVAGFISTNAELDYFDLGQISSGNTVFLSARQPAGSTLGPIVALYSQAGTLMAETNGVAGDGAAEIQIPSNGRYYALIRGSLGTTGLNGDYILDARVLPTSAINFPNLRVTRLDEITTPGLKTGDNINLSYTVTNVGNLATSASIWVDRVVISQNPVYGDADDIQLALITHNGSLAAGADYTVNQSLALKDGLPGSYYLLVKTDSSNSVDEILQEGDNVTATTNPFNVILKDYPDLLPENLVISEPDGDGNRTISWNLSNKGTGTAAAGHTTRLQVLNTTTSQLVQDVTIPVASPLAAAASVAQSREITTVTPGFYLVTVSADSGDLLYEFGTGGHATAEQNAVQGNFRIYRLYNVAVSASPAAGGSVSGGGALREGIPATVTATANTSVLPYTFLNWTEDGAFASGQANYTFVPTRDRNLVAVFGLPQFQIAVTVAVPGTGSVSGTGNFSINTPVSLTPNPAAGYLFDHWEEGGSSIGNTTPLAFNATANRNIIAFFREAVPSHVVATATQPANLAVIPGAGTYTNGQTLTITAPARVEKDGSEFLFQRIELNGQFLGTSPTFTKTVTTLDAASLQYTAIYLERSLKPKVTGVASSSGTLIPIASGVTFTATFDRDMSTSVVPVFALQSGNATAVPSVPAGGTWTDARHFRSSGVSFGATNGGAYTLRITGASDGEGRVMDPDESFGFNMDALVPANPVPTITASGPTSATFGWGSYAAPADLSGFRYYIEETNFTSVTGLSAKGGGNAAARSNVFQSLVPDREYFAAVTAVDVAGNSNPAVTPVRIFLQSQVPPPATPVLTSTGLDSVRLDWSTYDTSAIVGLSRFKIFVQTSPFTTVDGLTPAGDVAAATKVFDIGSLNRTQTYYIAVVAYNGFGQFNPAVTPLTWTDPLAGTLRTNLSVGGPTAVIPIHADLVLQDGAVLTIAPGTTLRFAAGAGIEVLNGKIIANGTDLLPIHFTSDAEGASPTRGAWDGITLSSPSGVSELSRVWVRYGGGLRITKGSPLVSNIYAVQNSGAGISVSNDAQIDAASCYLAFNENGLTASGSSNVRIRQSVILTNTTSNATQSGTAVLDAASNWWGSSSASTISASLVGTVSSGTPLTGEPVIGSALASASGVTDTGSRDVELRLMAVNAVKYRMSENAAFPGVAFTDLFSSDESFRIRPYGFVLPYRLSAGAGLKSVYLQTNSGTSTAGGTLSVGFNYITGGPSVTAFSLVEGQVVSRPLAVTGAATAPLGVKWIDLLVDGVAVARSSAATFNTQWDPRTLSSGIHRVELRARDQAGNESGRALNVVANPGPPPAPVITLPLNASVTNVGTTTVTGTAEPGIPLRVTRNGATVSGSVNAAPDGSFSVSGVSLVEGSNKIVVDAFDSLGSASSAPVTVVFDSGPPTAPVLLEPAYQAGSGLRLEWQYAITGERPTKFRAFWKNAPFTQTSEASGQSALLEGQTSTVLSSLPDGMWYFSIVGYDDAGNASVLSNQRAISLDFSKPTLTVAYDGALPAGPGNLVITVTSSEALVATPVFSIRPAGGDVVSVTLIRQSPTQFTANFAVTDLSAKSGTATVTASATDLAGNNFTGSPTGPALAFDVTKPTATLSYDRAAPIRTQNDITVQLGLQLSELPAVGSTPTLKFEPPVGADVPITLTGSGLSWTGSLPMTAAMGRGIGFFRLSVTDRSGNVGTVVTPSSLEIYNTALPDPPARPTGLSAQTLAAGRILINWDDVPRAESYKIYREPGNNATVPAILIADNLTTSDFTDTPPADGIYTYAIVATLRGADGPASGVLNALSDRTPPSVPLNFAATLGGTGVSISWSAPSGETPYSYHVYRGETSIFTSPTPVTINDNPPRGIHEYRVASVDSHGNENFATPITIELLVSPVKNMQVLVRDDSATSISWQSDDSTVTGYNVYRNGTKQNGAPLTNTFFVDQLPLGTTSVTYEVTARNAAGNESPRRSLTAIAANINLLLNPDANGVERDSAQFYFDSLRPVVTNVASTGTLRIERFDIIRTAGATDSLDTGTAASITLNPGETGNMDWIVPAPRVQGVPQTIQLIARGPADPSGGRVSYEKSFTKRSAVRSPNIATLQPVSPPLAGGLTDFVATIFNPSSVPIEIIIGRGFGNEAGDVSVRVLDPSGVEVYRKPFKGTGVSPVTVDGSGTAYITIPPSGSRSFTIPEIFVPESLGRAGLSATFILDIAAIRYRLGTGGLTGAGAIGGQTVSSLVETPYYGTAATSKTSYANNEPVHITGQAIDRTTLQPLANKPLRLGFGARGFVTWQDVTTDGSGNYQFDYTPVLGFAGRLNIWAAHPDVVDQLNQVTIEYRRLYVTPGRGDIVMSKNDTLDITLNTVNPGDLPASQVDVTARVFVMDGSNEVEITSIRAALLGSPFNILPNEQRSAAVRLTADLDAPDNALVDLTFLSSDGASATFRGSLSLRPAVPALSFSSPKVGYVEGSVNRGSIRSYQVTLQNLGLRPVENPEMFLPDNLNWVDVNLPRTADGRIQLQDIPVGGSVTFGVSFAPSESVPLGLYNGFFEVRASNLLSPFRINVFPQVTSSLVGDVKFAVDNIFVDPVPNAKIRMRNPNLREELGPFLTDANGEVTVPNLQEGTWSWQVTAAGHSTQTGTIDVVPGQVNLVQTRLSKSLVTVEFSVVPKPFTDRYEILIEQTFETRVPFPVLVFDPPSFKFTNIPDQYETTLLVKVRNEGLISMFDVQLQGETSSYASLQPLVNYMPELRAQEEVLVPFRLLWNRHGLGSEGTGAVTSSDLGGSISGCADASFKPNILDDDFMAGINAIGKAIAQCADGMTAALVCSLIVTIDTVDFIMGFVGLEAIAETLGKFLGCVFANYFKDFGIPSGGGGPGNGNGGGFEGRGCFPAGTPVTLSDGTRVPIEQVKKGQKVRSSVWQGHYGEAEDLIIRESETLRELTFREVRAGREPLDDSDLKLKITGEHLVWADVNGWTAASELKPGDWVHHESGALLEVAANDPIPGRHKVYTLEVNSANAFFASGVMVQDLCGLQKTGDKSVFSTPAITTEPLR